jgi:hypothetical protein
VVEEMLRRRQVEQKGMVPVTATTSLLVIGAGPDALSTAAFPDERGTDAAAGLIVQDLLARP